MDNYEDITDTLLVTPNGALVYDEEHIVAEAYGNWGYQFRKIDGTIRIVKKEQDGT